MPEEQKIAEYQPTLAEAKLLEVLLDPANRLKSVVEICNLANISRTTYYKIMDRPEFVKYQVEKAKELASKYAPQVMSAFVKEALRGSYPHGKVLLEMAGMHKDTVRKEVTGKNGEPIESNVNIISRTVGMSHEDIKALAAELRQADDDPEDFEIGGTDPGGR